MSHERRPSRINTITPHRSRLYIQTRGTRGLTTGLLLLRIRHPLPPPPAARFSFRFAARKTIRLDRHPNGNDVGGDHRCDVIHAQSNRGMHNTTVPCYALALSTLPFSESPDVRGEIGKEECFAIRVKLRSGRAPLLVSRAYVCDRMTGLHESDAAAATGSSNIIAVLFSAMF